MADITGTKTADVITGTLLQDLIIGQGENDVIDGSDGDDEIYAGSGDDTVFGSDGNDFISAGTGNDDIYDGLGNDVVLAGEGDDRVRTGLGDDTYQGGKGFDTIDFRDATDGVTVDLHKGTATGQGTDTLKDFEHVIGSARADTIRGSNGDDVIEAGNGKNIIRGGGGADDLTGGRDQDTFVWKTGDVLDANGAHRGVDTINLFRTNDTLDLRGVLSATTFDDINDVVHLTDTDAGTMVQVKLGDAFVDVALLAGYHAGGATASAWASDDIILA
jgi:Ca2+-binding RTX toxin-like protein